MKTLKRAAALLLLIAMLMTILCSCGGKNQDNGGSKDSNGESKEEERLEKLPDFEPLDWSEVEDTSAEDFTYEIVEGYDFTVGKDSCIVRLISYNGDDNIIKIPDRIEGYCVTEAEKDMFRGNTDITHVCLPTYLNLYYLAQEMTGFFSDCTSLLQVQMPLDGISVPMAMFDNCTSLREVTFPTSKESGFYRTEIGEFAFRGCTSLTSINLSEQITVIDDSAFEGCTRLEMITLDSVQLINYGAFEGCTSLKSVTAPKVRELRGEAFKDCVNLTELTLCEFITSNTFSDRLGSAFNGCTSLKTISLVPSEEQKDRYLVFEDGILYKVTEKDDGTISSALIRVLEYYREKEIVLRGDVTVIGSYAFDNMAFTTYEIPSSVQKVETRAFNNCPKLETVTEEKSSDFIYVDTDAFDCCPVLRIIDLSVRPWEDTHRREDDFYGYDCPMVEKVVFPGEGPNAAPITKESVTAAIEAVFEEYAEEMEAAGFTYEIKCTGDKLSQVQIFTNKDAVSSEEGALLKKLTFAIIGVPEAELDEGLIDQLQNNSFTGFGPFNYYFVGSDKVEFGCWADKGCLVLITNH